MDRTRYIVVNPDHAWIQGDVEAASHREAARKLEMFLDAPTANAEWHVHEAPQGVPGHDVAYRGNDPSVHALLRPSRPVVVANSRAGTPVAAMAS